MSVTIEVHAKHAGALLVEHIDAESTVEQLQIALAREFDLDASSVKLCAPLEFSARCRGLFYEITLWIILCPIPRHPPIDLPIVSSIVIHPGLGSLKPANYRPHMPRWRRWASRRR